MFTGGVAANGHNAYVAIREANSVAVLNGVTGELWPEIIADVGYTPGARHPDVVSAICRPQDVAITPDGLEVWVAFICGLESGGVAVIRHLTDRVVDRVQTGGPSWDVVITRDGAKAFVANWSPIHPPSTGGLSGLSSVSGINTASRTEDHRVELAANGARSSRDIATQPPGVALDPVGDSFADLAERTFRVWFQTKRKEVLQLYRYLDQPWRQLVSGKPSEAITQLEAFKGRVQSFMTAKTLTSKDGLTLIVSADAVIDLLVLKPPPPTDG
jgi:DNA-binding beta-propeller fold protein YncE